MGNNPDVDAKTDERRTVEVEVVCERWGSNKSSSIKIINAPMINENSVRLDITLDLRKTGAILIRPVRRELDDVDGMLEDAKRLANGA